MIDLHVHTNCSDGSDEWKEVLNLAERKGVKYLSITDHNTCEAYEKMKKEDISKYYSGTLINGIELNTKALGIGIELLGYGINTDIMNNEVKVLYKDFEKQTKNKREAKILYDICQKLGMNLDEKILEEYKTLEYTYASSYIHKKIKENSENRRFFTCDESWDNDMVFYRKEMSNPKSKFFIDSTKFLPTIQETIDLIKKAGGLVFVPHIYVYGENSMPIFEHITKNYKVDGFECYYSKFNDEQTRFLLEYCKKNKLYISGGSDYHGRVKPNIELGTGIDNKLKIEEKDIKLWIDKVI